MTTFTASGSSTQEGATTVTTTEYKFDDGSRWVRTEHRTPREFGFKYNVRTTVVRWGFDGDVQHRSSVKALNAATADAYEVPAPAPEALTYTETGTSRDFGDDARDLGHDYMFSDGEHWHAVTEWTKNTRGQWRSGRTRVFRVGADGSEGQSTFPALQRKLAGATEVATYRTMKPYLDAEPAARDTIDAVFAALDSAGYVGNARRGVSIEYPSGSVTASFALPNIDGEPTPYLVGITHDGYLIRLAKYVHTGKMERDEETGEDVPESIWQTVRNHEEDRAGAILAPALKGRLVLARWAAAAGY